MLNSPLEHPARLVLAMMFSWCHSGPAGASDGIETSNAAGRYVLAAVKHHFESLGGPNSSRWRLPTTLGEGMEMVTLRWGYIHGLGASSPGNNILYKDFHLSCHFAFSAAAPTGSGLQVVCALRRNDVFFMWVLETNSVSISCQRTGLWVTYLSREMVGNPGSIQGLYRLVALYFNGYAFGIWTRKRDIFNESLEAVKASPVWFWLLWLSVTYTCNRSICLLFKPRGRVGLWL